MKKFIIILFVFLLLISCNIKYDYSDYSDYSDYTGDGIVVSSISKVNGECFKVKFKGTYYGFPTSFSIIISDASMYNVGDVVKIVVEE